jgi:hypothetical protein
MRSTAMTAVASTQVAGSIAFGMGLVFVGAINTL